MEISSVHHFKLKLRYIQALCLITLQSPVPNVIKTTVHSAKHGYHEFFYIYKKVFYKVAKNGDCRANFKYVSSRIEFMDNYEVMETG